MINNKEELAGRAQTTSAQQGKRQAERHTGIPTSSLKGFVSSLKCYKRLNHETRSEGIPGQQGQAVFSKPTVPIYQ